MLTLFHVRGTRSVRPLWLCYELELEVDVVSIDFSRAYRDSEEWRRISPGGKVPALRDGELTMVESGAMQTYILDRFGEGRLQPKAGSTASALYHQWCWFAEATLTRPMGLHRILRAGDEPSSVLVQEGIRKANDALLVVEAALVDSDYLLGADFSAADIMMGYSLGLLEKLLDENHSACRSYLARVREREACARAMSA